MKNLFLKVILIPHDKGQNKWVKIPFILLGLVLLILILSGVFFFNNLQNFVNVSSLNFLESDNQKLKEKVAHLRKKALLFEAEIDSLLEEQKKTFRENNIMENSPEKPFNHSPESLLVISKWIDSIFETASKKDNIILNSVPSILPTKGHIIRRFGSQIDPYTGKKKPHRGISILTALNSPVFAAGDGIVKQIGNDKGKGLYVEITHRCGLVSSYSHLLNYTVKEGEKIKRGSTIGYVGQSGRAPYPYLYYEIKKDNVNLNPENFIFGGN